MGRLCFHISQKKGSFLPKRFKFFFVDPGVKAKYWPTLHKYQWKRTCLYFIGPLNTLMGEGYGHTAEITRRVPKKEVEDFAPA